MTPQLSIVGPQVVPEGPIGQDVRIVPFRDRELGSCPVVTRIEEVGLRCDPIASRKEHAGRDRDPLLESDDRGRQDLGILA